jgi:hypothetical protein
MHVTVKAMVKRGGIWVVAKEIECKEGEEKEYVKMFFDLGYEKVRVE